MDKIETIKPETITLELTKQELNTIIVFMERTQITGKESYTFVSLVTKLMSALHRPVKGVD